MNLRALVPVLFLLGYASAQNSTVAATTAAATNATAVSTAATNATTAATAATNATTASTAATNATTVSTAATNATTVSTAATNATTTTTSAAPITVAPGSILMLTFKTTDNYTSDLGNSSSPAFKNRSASQSATIGAVYQKTYAAFQKFVVLNFAPGSVITNGTLVFNGSNSAPSPSDAAQTLINAVNNNNLPGMNIDPKSISVTSNAPLLASMFTLSGLAVISLLTSTMRLC